MRLSLFEFTRKLFVWYLTHLRRLMRLSGECHVCGVYCGGTYCGCTQEKATPTPHRSWLEGTRGMDEPKIWRTDFENSPAIGVALDNKKLVLMVWHGPKDYHFASWERRKSGHIPDLRKSLSRQGIPKEIINDVIGPLGEEEIRGGQLHAMSWNIEDV